ncbi:MAG: PDZ domain-containing protein [Planctomycetes bacterium]|nr:PDZ domain-containing protein [Planctomycetota bacterium]
MLRTNAVVLLALIATSSPARGDQAPLDAALAAYFAAASGAETAAAVERVLALAPAPSDLLAALAKGPVFGAPAERGLIVRKTLYPDGKEHPWYLVMPESYDPAFPSPVLVHLHGGVSRPEPIPEEQMREYAAFWSAGAGERGILMVFPEGMRGAEWWSANGAGGIERILLDLRREFAVDENAVFATGFSDGASGCFYLAMTRPTTFAGFIPLNGHPAVPARAGDRQLHLASAALRPFYMVNTQDDGLYPTRTVLPFVEGLLRAGASVLFTSYPGIGHEPAYMDRERERIYGWMDGTTREPLPARVVFETANPEDGRVAWVTVLALGETPGAPEFEDVNVTIPEDRVRLGIVVDREFAGPGVRVSEVMAGTTAETMALRPGDVIVGLDEAEIASMADLSRVLASRRRGQEMEVRYRRDGEAAAARATIPPHRPEPAFPRTRPSGRIEVTAEGNRVDVRLRGVTRYALDLSPRRFDFDQELVVTTNGRESFRGKVAPDIAYLLRSHARDRDRSMLFLGRLEIAVPGE